MKTTYLPKISYNQGPTSKHAPKASVAEWNEVMRKGDRLSDVADNVWYVRQLWTTND